jgi:hypothetical protein
MCMIWCKHLLHVIFNRVSSLDDPTRPFLTRRPTAHQDHFWSVLGSFNCSTNVFLKCLWWVLARLVTNSRHVAILPCLLARVYRREWPPLMKYGVYIRPTSAVSVTITTTVGGHWPEGAKMLRIARRPCESNGSRSSLHIRCMADL